MSNRISLGIILGLTLLASPVKAAPETAPACNADAVIQDIRQKLSEIKSYKLKTQVSVNNKSVKAEITGKQPDRLKITMQGNGRSGTQISKAVFDGSHQWVQNGEKAQAQVLKINLQETTTAERPFDTGYYMMGTGLLNGEDFPSTIDHLISLYQLDAECSNSGVQLTGSLKPERFQSYTKKRNSPQSRTKNVERFKKQFGYLTLSVSSEGHMVHGYSLGPSSTDQLLKVDFHDIAVNPELESGTFDYTPPAGAEAADITTSVLDRRSAN